MLTTEIPIDEKAETSAIEITTKAAAHVTEILGLFKPDLDKYLKAEKLLKGAILKYQLEQEQIRRIEQEKVRKRIQAEEEKRRKELIEQAERAAAKGNFAKADLKTQEAEEVHKPVPILPETPKVDGIIEVKTWKARPANGAAEYDKKLIPEGFLLVNEKLLNEAARSTKGLVPIPGVEFYQETSITARS